MTGTPAASLYPSPASATPASSGLGMTTRIDPAIVQDIRDASRATNIDFGFLMAQAQHESGFHADAKASGSSATGLYQFVDSTWLDMVRQHGAKYGIANLAQAIGSNSRGQPTVSDPGLKQQILALRSDPKLSAAFAAEYAKDNKTVLENALGQPVGPAELRLAHFLGAGGATDLLSAVQENGATPAASILPDAAAANRSIFYDASGQPRTVAEVYQRVASEVGTSQNYSTALAGAPPAASTQITTPAAGMPSYGLASVNNSLGGRPLDPNVIAMLNSLVFTALHLVPDAGTAAEPATPLAAAPPHDHPHGQQG